MVGKVIFQVGLLVSIGAVLESAQCSNCGKSFPCVAQLVCYNEEAS